MKKVFFALIIVHIIAAYPPGKHEQEAVKYWSLRDIDIDSFDGHFNRAMMCYHLFEFELALQHINKALEISPCNIKALHQKGIILQWLGLFHQAVEVYDYLVVHSENKKDSYHGLHCCLQAIGKLTESYMASQLLRVANGQTTNTRPLDIATIKNKSVLIIAERCFGDQIQHIRFAKFFKDYGATKVIYAVDEKLVPLLSSYPYIDTVISVKNIPNQLTDVTVKQDELIFLLKLDVNTIPSEIPYLFADKVLIEKYNKELSDQTSFKIGICWHAKQGLFHEQTPYCNRSMPLAFFKQISAIANTRLFSLQKGPGEEQISKVSFSLQKLPSGFDEEHGAFVDTAAFIKNLDLVITVDTSIAHLAGALGVHVWVLLPFTADTRWMINRTDTPWYPTMKFFRQTSPGNWQSVIDQVIIALKEFIK